MIEHMFVTRKCSFYKSKMLGKFFYLFTLSAAIFFFLSKKDMIAYAKPVLFLVVVLLLNRQAVRPFPLIFTSILSSLNGVET